MNSHFITIGKKLITLTLIAGFLVMPIVPILADELSAPIETAPVAVDTSLEPVATEVVTAPELVAPDVVDPSVSTSTVSSDDTATSTCPIVTTDLTSTSPDELLLPVTPVMAIDQPEQKTPVVDIVGEDSFVTKSEVPLDDQAFDLSEELSFSTEVGDFEIPANMAISEENPFGDDVVIVDPSFSTEGQWETLPETGLDNSTISEEGSFTTTREPDSDESTVSGENYFTTTVPTEDNQTISSEQSFYTLSVPTDDSAVSAEQSFETLSIPTVDPAVSAEGDFTTLPGGDDTDPGISDEYSFTTLANPTEDPSISDEMSFTTLGTPDEHDYTVSEENSFTTESGSSGCTSNCGSHSSGGGQVLGEKVYRCEILLYKFIRLGQQNDRREVMKLQAFLRVYEGFKNLRITGIYDLPTYRAVEIFQKRYSKDILGPWKISDSTGYVYITTRIAINNIFCGRDTTNNADLRDEFYREYETASGEKFSEVYVGPAATSTDTGYFITPSTTDATSTTVVKKSWILASLGGLLGFVGDNLCWLLNLFLLLIILFLLWLLWLVDRDSESTIAEEKQDNSSVDLMGLPAEKLEDDFDVFREPIVNSSIGMVGAVALEELMTEDDQVALADLAEEEDSQVPAANNDPDQEKLLTND